MAANLHILVLDPIAFRGGSKVIGETILEPFENDGTEITAVTVDEYSWGKTATRRVRPRLTAWLTTQESGPLYFLRHVLIALSILWVRARYGRIDVAIGNSGPGVDLALYLCKPVLRYQLIQLVQGPVAPSRTIGRCLRHADYIHYLETTGASMRAAMGRVHSAAEVNRLMNSRYCRTLLAGLSRRHWPKPCQQRMPVVFWAASLLKWKGLDLLVKSLRKINPAARPYSQICYIRPRDTALPVSEPGTPLTRTVWHEHPTNIDEIRACSNIFVSTSKNEPFGLSILEGMAAGQCVVIPADGAYWDRVLKHGVNCVKYNPDDAESLAKVILGLSRSIKTVARIGDSGRALAQTYSDHRAYANIRDVMRSFSRTHANGRAVAAR